MTLAMLGLHAVLLVVDNYVDLSVGGALVPFTAGYRGYALGLGTLAVYGFVVVAATGALRGRLAARPRACRAWRGVHLSAYVAWALAMAHGVLAGTDTLRGWALAVYGGCAALVVGAAGCPRRRGAAHRRAPLPRARRLAAAPPAEHHDDRASPPARTSSMTSRRWGTARLLAGTGVGPGRPGRPPRRARAARSLDAPGWLAASSTRSGSSAAVAPRSRSRPSSAACRCGSRTHVLVNGSEGEPASHKDRALMRLVAAPGSRRRAGRRPGPSRPPG